MSSLLEAAGAAFVRATIAAQYYQMARVEEAIATLVAIGGESVIPRLCRESHERTPSYDIHDLTMRQKPVDLPLQVLTLDGERIWEGGYDGADWGFIWRERWMHEEKRHPVG